MFTRKAFISLISILLCCWNTVVLAQYPSLLWEISGNGLEKPSYLYGTIHTQDERVFAFGDSAKIAWDNVEVAVGELYISKDSFPQIIPYVMLPQDKQLSDYMTEKDYNRVMKFAEKYMGNNAALIKRMKPVYSAFFLSKLSADAKTEYPQRAQALDEYLQLLAREEGKAVAGLETYIEQVSVIDLIPMEEQVASLNEAVKEKKKDNSSLENLISVYLTQNLDSLMNFMKANPGYSENFSEKLVIERNHRMAERIIPIIKKRPAFIAVGAAHLPDKEGIIELLRQKGFTLRPVYSPLQKVEKK